MNLTEDPLEQLAADIGIHLRTSIELASVPVITAGEERRKSGMNERAQAEIIEYVNNTLGLGGGVLDTKGRVGLIIMVPPAKPLKAADNFPSVTFDVEQQIHIAENPIISNHPMTALQCSLRVLALLFGFSADGYHSIQAGEPPLEEGIFRNPQTGEFELGMMLYVVRMRTSFQGLDYMQTCRTPTAVNDSGTVTISCTTAGAEIWYGLRATAEDPAPPLPAPESPGARRYTAPIPVTGKYELHMTARKAGLRNSSRGVFTI